MTTNLPSLVRNLQRRGARRRDGLAVLEGIRLVEEAVAAGLEFRGALVSPSLDATERGARLRRTLADRAVPTLVVSDGELAALADTDTPQGLLAVVQPPRWSLTGLRPVKGAPVVVLDGLQDPGNVGALLRTAWALGAAGAAALPGTVALSHPKVLRGAMGATFRFPHVRCRPNALRAWLLGEQMTLWVADAHGTPVTRRAVPEHLAIVFGNEGAGVRSELRDLAARRVAVPLTRGVESLNVAVAAGILLHEVRRG